MDVVTHPVLIVYKLYIIHLQLLEPYTQATGLVVSCATCRLESLAGDHTISSLEVPSPGLSERVSIGLFPDPLQRSLEAFFDQ
jgi:hypothetical protein